MIEHNLDVIKTADYIIDIGPGGGNKGGHVMAFGTPEQVAAVPKSVTGKYLKPLLEKKKISAKAAENVSTPVAKTKAVKAKKKAA